jgi:benzoylformate decarboxylase
MKDIIKQYIDRGLSRRQFISSLTGLGLTATAARTMAKDFTPFVTRPGEAAPDMPDWARVTHGTGGNLLVEQLAAAGHKYLFINPSSGEAPVYDALVDRADMHIIQALHEGALTAMADGYARASGSTSFVMCARPGLPNAMTQIFNAWKDYTPMLVMVDDVDVGSLGQDGFEAMDHMSSMTEPMVKWHWSIETTARIPEVTRRAIKFASTHPRGPVFLACPEDLLHHEATAAIMDQSKFDVPMRLRPDPESIRAAAKLLLDAENPLIYAGNEVRYHSAEAELLELAELLGIPVAKDLITTWCKPFPTSHPLFIGTYQSTSRFPGKVDVMLNLGSRMPFFTGSRLKIEAQTKLIQVRVDPMNIGRVYPSELAIVADLKLALTDLIEEIRQRSSPRTLTRIASGRLDRAKDYQSRRAASLQHIATRRWDNAPISGERLAMELEANLDRDSVIVSENDTYASMFNNYLTYGPDDKDFFANSGAALGWGLPAAFGIKLGMPDRAVVALVTDGAFLFSGPQPLWSFARYQVPVTIIVLNNHSYNNERNRIMSGRGRSYQTGRDMVCYIGDPDIDYVKLAGGFGVDGEAVTDPDSIKAALDRAKRATAEGRPYLIDMHMERRGSMANSTWYPDYSVASLRTREV